MRSFQREGELPTLQDASLRLNPWLEWALCMLESRFGGGPVMFPIESRSQTSARPLPPPIDRP